MGIREEALAPINYDMLNIQIDWRYFQHVNKGFIHVWLIKMCGTRERRGG